MTNPKISFNRKITDPEMSDLLVMHKKDIFQSLNCHAIGTIQSFNSSSLTVSATINYKKSYIRTDSNGVDQIQLLDYPILLDVPVIVLAGGSASLTFPIAQGDECLILFNDRDIDNWFQSGQTTGLASGRLHSFSDGLALIGPRSMANKITSYDTARAVLRNGDALVGVGTSLIKLANATYTLNQLLQELITDINALVTATAAITVTAVTSGIGVSGPPANAAAIAAVGASLTATAAKIAGLLE